MKKLWRPHPQAALQDLPSSSDTRLAGRQQPFHWMSIEQLTDLAIHARIPQGDMEVNAAETRPASRKSESGKVRACLANVLELGLDLGPHDVVHGAAHVQVVDIDRGGLADAVHPVLGLPQVAGDPGVLRKHHHRGALAKIHPHKTSLLADA